MWDTRLDRCVISGMSQSQKIRFVFGVFDFDESGLLTVDEMILALRSTISGLCKLSGIDMPPETEIERIAVGAFANAKYGRLKLWRYPVVAKDAIGQDYCAHAAPGGNVAFTRDVVRGSVLDVAVAFSQGLQSFISRRLVLLFSFHLHS